MMVDLIVHSVDLNDFLGKVNILKNLAHIERKKAERKDDKHRMESAVVLDKVLDMLEAAQVT